jgi:tRNA(Ile2) C34 agmatinyltransferase TiaS
VNDDTPECPVCPGPGVMLGPLGRLMYWRCRDCGSEFSTVIQPKRKPTEEDDDD